MKGLCLGVQFKAYCGASFDGKLLSYGRRKESITDNTGIIR
jgi:hypothetical protein